MAPFYPRDVPPFIRILLAVVFVHLFLLSLTASAFQPCVPNSINVLSSRTLPTYIMMAGYENDDDREDCGKNSNNNNNKKNKSNKSNSSSNDNNTHTLVDAYTPLLNKRLTQLRAHLLEEQIHKPPNPSLSPTEFIISILSELRDSDTSSSSMSSLPGSGFRTLLRSSTSNWKSALRKSVGAPRSATQEQLVSALSAAMSRPNNQYQILVSSEDDDDDNDDGGVANFNSANDDDKEKYHLYFPGDVFEYDDGKAWVETQLRHPVTGKLLAILAWSLLQRDGDGAWLVDWIDWQDFRDAFRPGIGREEWSRICG